MFLAWIDEKHVRHRVFRAHAFWNDSAGLEEPIARHALGGYFSGFDALLYTSRAEGFGLMALEAASTGLPVFHSGRTGMSEYAHVGIVVPSREVDAGEGRGTCFEVDTDALACELRRFADEPEPYLRKAAADAEVVQRSFSWDATARAIEQRLLAP